MKNLPQQKDELIQQFFSKFLVIYNDIEAIALTDREGEITYLERRREDFIKTLEGLTNYLKPRIQSLLAKGSSFAKYGVSSMDSSQYRHLFIKIDPETILYIVLKKVASIEKIEPFALFLAEKVHQILTADKHDQIQTVMPSFQYESAMFEKYKVMIGFETGGIYRFKFCIIGDNAVGKTSVVRKFVEQKFDKDYKSTIGLNMLSHKFDLLNNEIHIVIWDLGGQAHYHRFRQQYYVGTQAVFIVFDLTNRETFDHAKNYWYEELRTFVKQEDLPIILVGNKADLKKQRKVEYEEGQKLADELSEKEKTLVTYVETSAATGENIEEAFGMIAYQFIMHSKKQESKAMQEKIANLISSILEKKSSLNLAFFTETLMWSPAIRILTEISSLGDFQLVKDESNEKIYQYNNGVVLRNYDLKIRDISDCDGIYCIFDMSDKEKIDPKWRAFVLELMRATKENIELVVGIRITEKHNWSQLLKEFNLEDELKKKTINLSFHEIRDEFQLEVHEQLKNMIAGINFYS